jgi:hypothetical protein
MVIGLDRLEEVARWAREEARGYEKQVEAIERSAGQEPVKPLEEFDPSALASARAAHEELPLHSNFRWAGNGSKS